MNISDSIQREWDRDEAEKEAWSLGDYTPDACPNCSRMRLCKCPNGKTRCEKCNWVVEDEFYCPLSNR